jgi:hypothetical protein
MEKTVECLVSIEQGVLKKKNYCMLSLMHIGAYAAYGKSKNRVECYGTEKEQKLCPLWSAKFANKPY